MIQRIFSILSFSYDLFPKGKLVFLFLYLFLFYKVFSFQKRKTYGPGGNFSVQYIVRCATFFTRFLGKKTVLNPQSPALLIPQE